METLAPSLWIDANVVDCWSAILNYEERFKEHGFPSRHFFPTGCIIKSMFDGTLASEDKKFESFEKEILAQFADNVAGLALDGIDLAFFPICNGGHFYVIVISLTKTVSITILDNMDSGATYDSKYKKTCDLLIKLFSRHLKLYGHKKHGNILEAKPKVPKLKWRTKKNFSDCGIFTMVHMECYHGEPATKWDCGLISESGCCEMDGYKMRQVDMLRRLRFKFATKILLHEINMHAGKLIDLAKEFDKLPRLEKMNIIVEAIKNREKREVIPEKTEKLAVDPVEAINS